MFKSRYKIRSPTYRRALFLVERAFDIVSRQGVIQRIQNAGVGRSYAGTRLHGLVLRPGNIGD
jgi:hypothetical protein